MLFGLFCLAVFQLLALLALVGAVVKLRDDMQFLKTQGKKMTAAFDGLKADVQADKAVVSSVVTLLKGIQDKLANVTSDDDLTALRADLAATIQPLADAVAANTPAAPTS